MIDPYSFGFLYATILGHFFIKPVISSMWDFLAIKHSGLVEGKGRYSSQPAILGMVERSLYYVSFIFGLPAFVGVWATLKTVAKSPRWANEDNQKQKRRANLPPGRALFQPFLVGNGLSILFSVAGYAITLMQTELNYLGNSFTKFAVIGPIALSLMVYWFSLIPLLKTKKYRLWQLILNHFIGIEK